MPSSYIRVLLHTTFGTKFRQPLILPKYEEGLHKILRQRLTALDSCVHAVGGTMDHVHLLHGLPRTMSVADLMSDVKSNSSKWMRQHGNTDFQWQVGYACHSVDYRRRTGVLRYIQNQKVHHYGSRENYFGQAVVLTFEQEYRKILDSFDLDYDKRYLFPKPAKVA